MTRFSGTDLAAWCAGTWEPHAPARVDGVSNHSKTLPPGSLYVAIKGARHDGHAFVAEAFDRGAGAALVADAWSGRGTAQRPLLRVADTGRALRDLAAGYRRRLGADVVAVTGSAGKSTAKEMLADMLAGAMPTARTKGNWNNEIGLPLSLLAMPPGTRVAVLEAGISHPGEMDVLAAILEPTCAVVTNIGPVHIEFFESEEAIAREKGRLLARLPADGAAVLNADGGGFDALAALCPCPVLTVSLEREADLRCVRREIPGRMAFVRERASGGEVALHIPAPGRHNVIDAMLAAAMARRYRVGWDAIAAALAAYRPLPMRWQELRLAGLRVINDAYNANPLSVEMATDCFAELPHAGGRKWLVLGGMLELGRETERAHRRLGERLAGGEWAGLVAVGRPGALFAEGARSAGMAPDRVAVCADAGEAAAVLRERARPGDAVLLKASRGVGLEEVVTRLSGEVRHGDKQHA